MPHAPGVTVLEARGIAKSFPGVRALDSVDIDVGRGEVHALVGENGAGKSTLMHVLAGVYQPEAGDIMLDGAPVRFRNPHDAIAHGISVVFQELSLVPGLSIAENIFANRQPVGALNFIDRKRLDAGAADLLRLFNLDIHPATPVRRVSMGQRQMVEILKAVSQHPKLLILDEPTSSLSTSEIRLLFDNIRRLQNQGVSFIYISHHLPEIFEIAGRVTILRDGRRVDTRNVSDVTEEDLIRNMVGRELVNMYGARQTPIGDTFFRIENAGRANAFSDVSFTLRRGEILGMAGLVGAGRTEIARAIAGVEPIDRGRIQLDGAGIAVKSPRQAIARGIGYLTEDRKEQGLFPGLGLRENIAAPSLARFAGPFGLMRDRAITQFAAAARDQFKIAAPSLRRPVFQLSGGNQQKALLAAWVGTQPKLLIVDEPTRGVDVGAKSDIYARIRELAAAGIGILVISSDLPELLGLCDRILVIRAGRIAGEFDRQSATEETVIACAAGVQLNPQGNPRC
jgi:ABC-type sugar transport system ATPase subunit